MTRKVHFLVLLSALLVISSPVQDVAIGSLTDTPGGLQEAFNCVSGITYHEFYTTIRGYNFEGACKVTNYTSTHRLWASAMYRPESKSASEEIHFQHPQHGHVWMKSRATFNDDPWLYPERAGIPQNLTVSFSEQALYEGTFVNYERGMLPFRSATWITGGGRTALQGQAAAAPPPSCSYGEERSPSISRPAVGRTFPAGTRRVDVSSTFPCRFEDKQYQSRMAYIWVEFQATVRDPGAGEVYHMPVDKSNIILMRPNAEDLYDTTSYGEASIPVDYDGQYQIRFRAQWAKEGGIAFSKWSDWIPFWIGDKFLQSSHVSGVRQLDSAAKKELMGSRALDVSASSLPSAAAIATDVALKSIYTDPESPTVGKPFDIYVEFWNGGEKTSDQNQQYTIDCVTFPSGASCPIAEGARNIGQSIAVNATVPVKIPVTASSPGTYRIKISVGPSAAFVAKNLEFTVKPPGGMNMQTEPTPKKINPVPVKVR